MSLVSAVKNEIAKLEINKVGGDLKAGKLGDVAGRVWAFLDGKKTVVMAIILAAETIARQHGVTGPLTYVDIAVNAVGWGKVAPAVDPAELVTWVGMTLGLGHKIVKAASAPTPAGK